MRAIDADALLKAIIQMSLDGNVFDRIHEAPTIEPRCEACEAFNKTRLLIPQRKMGKWIPVTNGRGGHECDQCHEYAPSWATGEEHLTNYCPNCGADMTEESEDIPMEYFESGGK